MKQVPTGDGLAASRGNCSPPGSRRGARARVGASAGMEVRAHGCGGRVCPPVRLPVHLRVIAGVGARSGTCAHTCEGAHTCPRVRPAVRGVYAARPAAAGRRRAELAHLGTGPTPGHLSPELAHLSLCTPGNVRVCTHLRAHSGLWTICICARRGILASLGIFLHPYNNPPLFFPSW